MIVILGVALEHARDLRGIFRHAPLHAQRMGKHGLRAGVGGIVLERKVVESLRAL